MEYLKTTAGLVVGYALATALARLAHLSDWELNPEPPQRQIIPPPAPWSSGGGGGR